MDYEVCGIYPFSIPTTAFARSLPFYRDSENVPPALPYLFLLLLKTCPVFVAPENVPPVYVAPKNVPSISVAPENVPPVSVAPENVPSISVAPSFPQRYPLSLQFKLLF